MKKMIVKLLAVVMTLMTLVSFAGCSTVDKYLDLANEVVENMENVQQQDSILDMVQSSMQAQAQTQTQPSFSYEEMIESFVPDAFNCQSITVGGSHKPNAAIWLTTGKGEVYSSDETVVTVSQLGKVTAVGEGEAYVIISCGTLFQVMRYTVTTE